MNIITTEVERRQIAKTLEFPADFVPYINWESIAEQRRELACNLDVSTTIDGGLTIVFYWFYDDGNP